MRGSRANTSSSAASGPRVRSGLAGVALVVLVVVAYVPASSAGWIWDDDDYVVENRTLQSLDGLRRIWFEIGAVPQYYPLVHTTFWFERRLWGLDPAGYHAVNIGLHALGALLAWGLLRRLRVPGAWLAAALFAVHPVHVESVAWVTERKNVLSTVLYLAAFLAYLRFRPLDGESPDGRGRARAWTAAFVLFSAALLAKTVVVSLPAAILVVTWWKKGRVRWDDVRPTLPMFALGAALAIVTVWMEKQHVGATGAAWNLSAVDRLLVASRALTFYLGKLAWPHPLAFVYERWTVDAATLSWWLFPAAVAACASLLWALRSRVGRGPFAALLLFAGTLFPALGFFDVYPMRFSFVADHFQYLASLAPLALVAAAGTAIAVRAGTAGRRLAAVAAAVVLAVLAGLTWHQCGIYRDEETLWRDTVRKTPSAFIAHNNLGGILLERGEAREARRHFDAALAIDPAYPESHVNLGLLLERDGRRDEAIARYRTAIAIDPAFADAHNNLGIALAQAGDLDGAIDSFRRALAHRRDFPKALYNLGVALVRAGRAREAIDPLERALRLAPGDADTLRALEAARANAT